MPLGLVFSCHHDNRPANSQSISLVEQADDLCNEAKRLLHHTAQYTRLASEDMTDAQWHLMDAVTHMQTRPLRQKKKIAKRA